jgi:glycerol-3-phosphate O-acyltransferase
MNAVLQDSMSILTVQQLFNELFPFLKIEFFEKETKQSGAVSVRRHINSTTKKLSDFKQQIVKDAQISISPLMTVAELEKEFTTIYKLQTQVFRKSGNIWLETTITDGWSLEEQNHQGEIITAQMKSR